MNVHEIRDRALSSGRSVFDYDQLSALAGVPRDQARVYASRLVEKKLADKVIDGVLSFSDDPFLVASQLVEPSYVSMTSALYLRGAISQVPAVVDCVTPLKSFALEGPRVSYHRIVPSLFFGFERTERYGGYVFTATIEKAAVDLVYFGGSPPRLGKDLDARALDSMKGPYGKHGGPRGRRVVRWVESR